MKKYVSQPTEPGCLLPYCVAKFDSNKANYIPVKGEEYPTRELAAERAAELNRVEQEDSKQ